MAKDLQRDVPASPFDELEGFRWLPRMLDKARATLAGTHGDYTPFPCPGDRSFLKLVGLPASTIVAWLQEGLDDQEIARRLRTSHAPSPEALARFREQGYLPPRQVLVRWLVGIFVRREVARLRPLHPDRPWERVDTLAKLLAAEEGHPVP